MKVLLITGGTTSERKISLISAKEVKKGLGQSSHKAQLFDLKKGYPALKKLFPKFDIFFPVLHGEEGEGGSLQKFLKQSKVEYVGGDPNGFKKGWFKIPFKKYCDKNNIITARWKIVKKTSDIKKFGFPSVLKSTNGGSSREVVILKSSKDLSGKAFQVLLKSGFDLFAEKYLSGVEVTVAILGNRALPVIEIVPPKGSWFNYKNKYSGKTKEIIEAPSIDESLKKKIQLIALNLHKKLKLGPYSRIDFIVSDNTPYILEINTIPGLTSESLFPKAAAAVGLSFPKLLDKIIKLAHESKIPQTK